MSDPLAVKPQSIKDMYDYIIVGAGASGSVVAGELSKTGAEVLVIESGPADTAPTISNPSIWFYNMPTPLNYALPFKPAPARAPTFGLGQGSEVSRPPPQGWP